MKLSWGLTFISLLFAANIYEGETTESNHPRLKRDKPWYWSGDASPLITNTGNQNDVTTTPVSVYTDPKKPNLNKSGRSISETKCLEYISEHNERAKLRDDDTMTFFLAGVGGRDAFQGEYPHMGALGWRTTDGKWSFNCGSSLISHKFLLTAAHCSKIPPIYQNIVNQVPEIVRLGDVNISESSEHYVDRVDAEILRIIVHPKYSSPKKYYDIALIELVSKVKFNKNVGPVCLWNRFDTSSLGLTVSSLGWGVVDPVTRKTSSILQKFDMDMIESELCDNLLRTACSRRWCGIQEHQMCSGKLQGGVDACQGDSGGPLQVKINYTTTEDGSMYFLIGVTSFGIGCARPNSPGVYTRVSSFVDWVERIVWPEV